MNTENAQKYKEKLQSELALLEKELSTVGRVNPENPKDWEAVPEEMDITNADPNETADTIESFENNTAILKQLETRHEEIKRALAKIDDGSYGICEIGGEEIEEDRLEANPAARTCKAHMGQEKELV